MTNFILPAGSLNSTKKDTNKRDLHYSNRHRLFPNQFYWSDMDKILYNFNRMPVAAIELKHANLSEIDLQEFQIDCHRNSANLMRIPFFVVQYFMINKKWKILSAQDQDDSYAADYYVIPANQFAKQYLTQATHMSEREYVQLNAELRNLTDINFDHYSNDLLGFEPAKVRNSI